MHIKRPWMSSELEVFRDNVRRFVAEDISPHEKRWAQQQSVDRELWTKAGALGLLCPAVPEAYGGAGGDFRHDAIILEEQSYAGNTAWAKGVHEIVVHYVLACGTEDQKKRWLPKLASGDMVGAIAMTEPGTGSDLQSIRSTARLDGDNYIVNGSKTFISNGLHCGLLIIVCKTDASLPGSRGISLLVAETDGLPGFRRGRLLEKIGQKGQDTAELFFEDVCIPAENLLGGREGRGFMQLMQQLPHERLILAMGAQAAAEQAIAITLDYVKERKAFGQKLIEFQNTRFTLAELHTHTSLARSFVDRCVEQAVKGELDTSTASMAKLACTDNQCRVVDACLQLFGGYGYMLEYPIAQMYADARVQKIYGGSNEIMKEIIARSLASE
ncbi:acyl-CoA dehydrogenase family protein [Oceanococcus atlanticus]|nr:acyl-CoA dehydrogenase family protein [Oceanococcus atlanticus]